LPLVTIDSKRIDLGEEEFDNVITIAFAAVDGRQQDNKERSKIRFDKIERREEMAKITIVSLEDWAKVDVDCYSARMWTDFRVRVSGQE